MGLRLEVVLKKTKQVYICVRVCVCACVRVCVCVCEKYMFDIFQIWIWQMH